MIQRDFSIKVCGITTPSDAVAVALAGADAVGLNFYPGSKRFVDRIQAQAIVKMLPAEVVKVGVFVNAPPEEMLAIYHELQLDWIQLHGDETAETADQLGEVAVIKAFRWDGSGAAIERFAASLPRAGSIGRVLIDSAVAGQYGGSGATADWHSIRRWAEAAPLPTPLILAGGLTPQNVATAIRESGIARVDTASGVESAPGRKDAEIVSAFVAAARAGAATMQASGTIR